MSELFASIVSQDSNKDWGFMDICVYILLEVKNKKKQDHVHFINLLLLNSVFMEQFWGIYSRLINSESEDYCSKPYCMLVQASKLNLSWVL